MRCLTSISMCISFSFDPFIHLLVYPITNSSVIIYQKIKNAKNYILVGNLTLEVPKCCITDYMLCNCYSFRYMFEKLGSLCEEKNESGRKSESKHASCGVKVTFL